VGGRGSVGGTRSTYRGNSTTLYRQKQAQGGDAGGGGGSTKNKTGNAGAGTGGIEGGGGSAGGLGGGGSTVETKPTETDQTTDTDSSTATDINEQDLSTLTDEQLVDMFEQSEIFDELVDKYPGDAEYNRNRPLFYSRWLKSEGLGAPAPANKLEMEFADNVTTAAKTKKIAQFDQMPTRIREELFERGVKINVGRRADDTDRWGEYAPSQGIDGNTLIADGRKMGELNFYDSKTNDIFISTSSKDSSFNVMVHEMGHGVDAKWNKTAVDTIWVDAAGVSSVFQVKEISRDDPDFIYLHDNYVKNNTGILPYYRGGPSGTSDEDGRSELFAESMAAYFHGGRQGMVGFLAAIPNETGIMQRDYVIDAIIGIWYRYGILE
jgi:hypothetical protein